MSWSVEGEARDLKTAAARLQKDYRFYRLFSALAMIDDLIGSNLPTLVPTGLVPRGITISWYIHHPEHIKLTFDDETEYQTFLIEHIARKLTT